MTHKKILGLEFNILGETVAQSIRIPDYKEHYRFVLITNTNDHDPFIDPSVITINYLGRFGFYQIVDGKRIFVEAECVSTADEIVDVFATGAIISRFAKDTMSDILQFLAGDA